MATRVLATRGLSNVRDAFDLVREAMVPGEFHLGASHATEHTPLRLSADSFYLEPADGGAPEAYVEWLLALCRERDFALVWPQSRWSWLLKAQDRFAADLAAFLRDLHTIPSDALTAAGLPPAPSPLRSPALWRDHLAAIRAELFPHLWADQQAAIEDLFAPVLVGRLAMTNQPALIHNDLAAYHLLANPNSVLTGVLDFGEAGWGDPAADTAALISGYGESFVARMIAVYPAIAAHLERARFRAAYIELEWALKGVRTTDPAWFLVHLGRARDSRPFGAAG